MLGGGIDISGGGKSMLKLRTFEFTEKEAAARFFGAFAKFKNYQTHSRLKLFPEMATNFRQSDSGESYLMKKY